ncbi:hypothetical protein J4439_08060 [Candidatus Woesearchaeota archaeon]|nr:hypothetical protein [Candidatus Woesearchaeota archaeon]
MPRAYPVKEFPHQLTLIYGGVFHYKYLYMAAYDWITEHGWRAYEEDDKVETLYAEDHDARGRKVWIWWRLQKGGDSSYYHYFLDVNFLGLGVTDVEVVKDGKKVHAQKGELDIIIRPWIEVDYGGRWAKHWLLKNFNDLFQKRVFKGDIEQREVEMLREVYQFHGMLKKTLEMKVFTEDKELYGPKRAI